MNPRELPKRLQGLAMMVVGMLFAIVNKWLQIGMPDAPALNLGVFEVPALPLPQSMMLVGFAYMLVIGFGDQARKAFVGRNGAVEDDE